MEIHVLRVWQDCALGAVRLDSRHVAKALRMLAAFEDGQAQLR